MNPNPGSAEAIKQGCTCPVMANDHGRGCGYQVETGEPIFWTREGCPLHGGKNIKEEAEQ
jgi:hypothetical protein